MIDAKTFPGRGKVAILRTRPETVLDDYYRLMHLCDYEQNLPQDKETLLKINISWQIWYPACSTTPWQLDGVIRTLLRDGYKRERIIAAHNNTVVVDAKEGARNNRHKLIQDHYGIHDLHTYEQGVEWVRYEPHQPLAVLDKIYPDGVFIPKAFYGKNVLHLPTMKTHVFTTLTGAMKNAFGGLLDEKRHWTHANIHDTLVDLLQIQQDIHTGIFCVMDGTFAGEGPGPRAMRPHVKNTIMASADPVAIDAMSAKIMGIDPLRVRFIRHAHERGLGVGDPKQIQIVGDSEVGQENWHFAHDEDTFASWGQKQIYHGALKPLEKPLLRTPLVPWSYAASNVYHNLYWYPFIGARRAELMLNTTWGQKFLQYSEGLPFNPGASSKARFALASICVAVLAAIGLGAYYSSRRGSQI
ncbi:MAG TPA: DUF362 domain-containing protein [Anaerolineae bacterium]|nr:DUF362 domain-containing protein [Anaerolineae bacterium]